MPVCVIEEFNYAVAAANHEGLTVGRNHEVLLALEKLRNQLHFADHHRLIQIVYFYGGAVPEIELVPTIQYSFNGAAAGYGDLVLYFERFEIEYDYTPVVVKVLVENNGAVGILQWLGRESNMTRRIGYRL